MHIQQLFELGMKRSLPPLLDYSANSGTVLNIGSSPTDAHRIPGARDYGKPNWLFPIDPILEPCASVSTIHCYHFLEHLSGKDAIAFLRECERVMIPGASVMNFCIPYYNSNLQAECLDHKSRWNENSFRNLFENSGYDIAGKWELRQHFVMIAGIVERNLCIIGQLVR